jgi:hypothetical protein
MFNLTINSTNVANSLNNMYQYQFKNGAFEVPAGAEMMITSLIIPYSWYNISSRYNNNTFKIYWPNGAVGNYTAFTLTLDDGFYTVNALNARIQQFCIEKGMYLTDGSGNNVYYVSITPNSTAYANQIITKLVPLSLPTGFVQPTDPAFAGYPTTTKRPPYIEILSNNNFGKFLGFTAGNYGITKTADYNVLSNLIPQGSTVNSLLIKCSLVNNGCSNQSDVLDAFAIGGSSGGTFGGNLTYTNTIEKFVKISEGRYNNFIVTIVDQNNNDITILDNNLLINFLIRVK